MEDVKIAEFLSFGAGFGFCDGFGSGSDSGFGSGFGDGLKSINGQTIYRIDGVPTLINRIHGNIAKSRVLKSDLSLELCYVVKGETEDGAVFAHGTTLREARDALLDKLFHDLPEHERIAAFVREHEAGKEYPNTDFFGWHHRLTGSCEQGRRVFAQNHGIDVERGSMTVAEFIALTEHDYGGATIRKLREYYP